MFGGFIREAGSRLRRNYQVKGICVRRGVLRIAGSHVCVYIHVPRTRLAIVAYYGNSYPMGAGES